ncbi:unannotated protein [freshwater metagenome]|uniref:Unannotated protein n=1 Tax=freshwater metagenome TaxID=449393 RepID=A0A6J6Y5N6_9ZZZZ
MHDHEHLACGHLFPPLPPRLVWHLADRWSNSSAGAASSLFREPWHCCFFRSACVGSTRQSADQTSASTSPAESPSCSRRVRSCSTSTEAVHGAGHNQQNFASSLPLQCSPCSSSESKSAPSSRFCPRAFSPIAPIRCQQFLSSFRKHQVMLSSSALRSCCNNVSEKQSPKPHSSCFRSPSECALVQLSADELRQGMASGVAV